MIYSGGNRYVELIFLSILFAVVVGVIARSRNRNVSGRIALSVFIGSA